MTDGQTHGQNNMFPDPSKGRHHKQAMKFVSRFYLNQNAQVLQIGLEVSARET